MNLELALISLVILIFSAILHEIAHGLVAEKLGDPTARLLGRLTLNPRPHFDFVFTFLMPVSMILIQLPLLAVGMNPLIIGGAKPVPVDPFNFREPKKDMALVSLAGPLTNFLIAFSVALIYQLLSPFFYNNALLVYIIRNIVYLNLMLGVFNLIPIPPLDGSKVFALFLSEKTAAKYLSLGSFGIFIIFFLLMPISPIPLGSFISNILTSLMGFLGFQAS
jgi:Zn-dependent protease